MATMRCRCGTTFRDDDPDDGLLLFTRRDYDVDLDAALLSGRARQVWRCRTCGRFWVYWDHLGDPAEYLPADLAPLEAGPTSPESEDRP